MPIVVIFGEGSVSGTNGGGRNIFLFYPASKERRIVFCIILYVGHGIKLAGCKFLYVPS